MNYKKAVLYFFIMILLSTVYSSEVYSSALSGNQPQIYTQAIQNGRLEKYVCKQLKESKIPGTSIVIVHNDEVLYKKGFGYADIKEHKLVTSDTLFELGSNSKAFTALGVLDLSAKGLINLDDPVKKYLPWLNLKYKGKAADVKLSQLLYHTSGIPYKTIGSIPQSEKDDALEATVRNLCGVELDHLPGESFFYATINYDVLGLVIQKVSGVPFEKFMQEDVLRPLSLNNTFAGRQQVEGRNLAKGYKIGFFRGLEYDAPMYRGNTAAGYFISNANDMEKWLKIQLGVLSPGLFDKLLIEESHKPDRSVYPSMEGSTYAAGWSVYQSGGGEISHGGSNPNYSSFIAFRPQEKIGIAILANMNSSYTKAIGQGIMDMLQEKEVKSPQTDTYRSLDNISVTVICVAAIVFLITIWFIFVLAAKIIKGRRKFTRIGIKGFMGIITSLLLMLCLMYCVYKIPEVLFQGLSWSFVRVWAPSSFIIAVILVLVCSLTFYLYYIASMFFSCKDEKPYFLLIVLSLVSGFGNALNIFVINEAVNREDSLKSGLYLYFIFGLLIYICIQKYIRTRMVTITNELVYSKRMVLVQEILKTPFHRLENLENGKIHAGLNNDTETLSNFANIIITGATGAVTLICCFIYLGVLNFTALLLSMLVIFMAAGLYFAIGRVASRVWEQTRDIQNVFFRFINDLVGGFKELKLNRRKLDEFKNDMQANCNEYKEKRNIGALKFANAFIVGELVFTVVIGAVAFIFPLIFTELQNSTLRNYIFVFLYMTGPVHAILNSIPNAIQARISWRRIDQLIAEISLMDSGEQQEEEYEADNTNVEIVMKDVEYSYSNDSGESFTVGPINCSFRSNEITFITGGNGSGKSTLAKLISGLYIPEKGEIALNGKNIANGKLRQHFSAIFGDFYIFEKLYGIDYSSKVDEIESYLKTLQIDQKLKIDQGKLSTTRLSTGQRKRIALLISYLEDRPVYIFDEWAADQDPSFREFFYFSLLPEFKKRGKCVIAITHDNRYFDVADRLIKMEVGKIVE